MTLGAQNGTANISDPNIEAGNVIGFLHLDSGSATTSVLDNSEIKELQMLVVQMQIMLILTHNLLHLFYYKLRQILQVYMLVH